MDKLLEAVKENESAQVAASSGSAPAAALPEA